MNFFDRHRWFTAFCGVIGVFVVFGLLFQWDWIVPLVNMQASSVFGRPVRIEHLRVRLGATTRIEMLGVTLDNPPNWPGGGRFAHIDMVRADLQLMDYLQDRVIILPRLDLIGPKVEAEQRKTGQRNWLFPPLGGDAGSEPRLSSVRIARGEIHLRHPGQDTDLTLDIATRDQADGGTQLAATIEGRTAGQPVRAQFLGGALLALWDAGKPYPVDLKLASEDSRASLSGTVRNPLSIEMAELQVNMAGPNLALLQPFSPLPLPPTGDYRFTGKLTAIAGVTQIADFSGRIGRSDVGGTLKLDTKPTRPVLVADLETRVLYPADLLGLIGLAPQDGAPVPWDLPALPGLDRADLHLRYRAAKVQGQHSSFDNLIADIDLAGGALTIRPLSIGLGRSPATAELSLTPQGDRYAVRSNLSFARLDLAQLRAATGFGRDTGLLGGHLALEGTGHTLLEALAAGTGDIKLYLSRGGDLAALLRDTLGPQRSATLLPAFGTTARGTVECAILDAAAQKGIATIRTLQADTEDMRIGARGTLDLAAQTLGLTVEFEPRRPGITPPPAFDITGPVNSPVAASTAPPPPTARPATIPMPLSPGLMPTIPFTTGDDQACLTLLRQGPVRPRP